MKIKETMVQQGEAFADISKIEAAIEKALDDATSFADSKLKQTTTNWKTKVDFKITRSKGVREIWTSNDVYGFVNFGSKPHIIRPKRARRLRFWRGGRAKTQPRSLTSGAGARGDALTFANLVHHPGVKAREFTDVIQGEADTKLAENIDSELSTML